MHELSNTDSTDHSFFISLVICTRNRAQFLPKHLASLAEIQSPIAWEIIFVDNISSDETLKLLAEFSQVSKVPVTIISEKKIGLGSARNAGWTKSRAKVVAFTDDDCYPALNYIDVLTNVFADEALGFVGGRVLLHDPKDLPITIKTSNVSHLFLPNTYIGPGLIHGANFAFRKNVLKKVEGFDPLMGAGTAFPCEDCDILLRASYAGFKGKYCPEIVVEHHHRRQSKNDLMKIESAYLAGRGAFFMKTLLNSAKPWFTFYQWLRSAKYFGLVAFGKEIVVGYSYLRACKKQKLKP